MGSPLGPVFNEDGAIEVGFQVMESFVSWKLFTLRHFLFCFCFLFPPMTISKSGQSISFDQCSETYG